MKSQIKKTLAVIITVVMIFSCITVFSTSFTISANAEDGTNVQASSAETTPSESVPSKGTQKRTTVKDTDKFADQASNKIMKKVTDKSVAEDKGKKITTKSPGSASIEMVNKDDGKISAPGDFILGSNNSTCFTISLYMHTEEKETFRFTIPKGFSAAIKDVEGFTLTHEEQANGDTLYTYRANSSFAEGVYECTVTVDYQAILTNMSNTAARTDYEFKAQVVSLDGATITDKEGFDIFIPEDTSYSLKQLDTTATLTGPKDNMTIWSKDESGLKYPIGEYGDEKLEYIELHAKKYTDTAIYEDPYIELTGDAAALLNKVTHKSVIGTNKNYLTLRGYRLNGGEWVDVNATKAESLLDKNKEYYDLSGEIPEGRYLIGIRLAPLILNRATVDTASTQEDEDPSDGETKHYLEQTYHLYLYDKVEPDYLGYNNTLKKTYSSIKDLNSPLSFNLSLHCDYLNETHIVSDHLKVGMSDNDRQSATLIFGDLPAKIYGRGNNYDVATGPSGNSDLKYYVTELTNVAIDDGPASSSTINAWGEMKFATLKFSNTTAEEKRMLALTKGVSLIGANWQGASYLTHEQPHAVIRYKTNEYSDWITIEKPDCTCGRADRAVNYFTLGDDEYVTAVEVDYPIDYLYKAGYGTNAREDASTRQLQLPDVGLLTNGRIPTASPVEGDSHVFANGETLDYKADLTFLDMANETHDLKLFYTTARLQPLPMMTVDNLTDSVDHKGKVAVYQSSPMQFYGTDGTGGGIGTTVEGHDSTDDNLFGIVETLYAPSDVSTNWVIYVAVPRKGQTVPYSKGREAPASEYSLIPATEVEIDSVTGAKFTREYFIPKDSTLVPNMNALSLVDGETVDDIKQRDDIGDADIGVWKTWAEMDDVEKTKVSYIRIIADSIPAEAELSSNFFMKLQTESAKTKVGDMYAYTSLVYNYMQQDGTMAFQNSDMNNMPTNGKGSDYVKYILTDFKVTGQLWQEKNFNNTYVASDGDEGTKEGMALTLVNSKGEALETNYGTPAEITMNDDGTYSALVPSKGTYYLALTATEQNWLPVSYKGGNIQNGMQFVPGKDKEGDDIDPNIATATVTVTNDDIQYVNGGIEEWGDLTIDKEITGTYADYTKKFGIKIKPDGASLDRTYTGTFTYSSGTGEEKTLTGGSDNPISFGKGDSFTVRLPVGLGYTITDDEPDYTANVETLENGDKPEDITINPYEMTQLTNNIVNVTYTGESSNGGNVEHLENVKTTVVQSGIGGLEQNYILWLVLFLSLLGAGAFWYNLKRKGEER